MAKKKKKINLRRLLSKATVATPEESAEFFKGSDKWGETLTGTDSPTGKPIIYINDGMFAKYGAPLTPEGREKAALSESIHLMKDEYPEEYNDLLNRAKKDPEMSQWFKDSYARESEGPPGTGETRPFNKWLRNSRFDQVIGGYMFGGDPTFPTMKNWNRDKLPFGSLREDFEGMRQDNHSFEELRRNQAAKKARE